MAGETWRDKANFRFTIAWPGAPKVSYGTCHSGRELSNAYGTKLMEEGGSMTACTYRIYGTVMNMMTNLTMKYITAGATKSSGRQLNGEIVSGRGAKPVSVCDRRAPGAFLDLRQGRQARHLRRLIQAYFSS